MMPMVFSDSIKDDVFAQSGGRCECTRSGHSLPARRCIRPVTRTSAQYNHLHAQSLGGIDGLY
jgi:hypothetical protein